MARVRRPRNKLRRKAAAPSSGRVAIDSGMTPAVRKARRPGAGRHANHPGNLKALFSYVEFYRRQKTKGGVTLGISGACRQLKKRLNFYMKLPTTAERLRKMYYDASKVLSAADLAEARAEIWEDNYLPLLLETKTEGKLADELGPEAYGQLKKDRRKKGIGSHVYHARIDTWAAEPGRTKVEPTER